jgi:hypothetical protein
MNEVEPSSLWRGGYAFPKSKVRSSPSCGTVICPNSGFAWWPARMGPIAGGSGDSSPPRAAAISFGLREAAADTSPASGLPASSTSNNRRTAIVVRVRQRHRAHRGVRHDHEITLESGATMDDGNTPTLAVIRTKPAWFNFFLAPAG